MGSDTTEGSRYYDSPTELHSLVGWFLRKLKQLPIHDTKIVFSNSLLAPIKLKINTQNTELSSTNKGSTN